MNEQIEREILVAHADRLNAGLRGAAAYPPMTADQRVALEPLLQLTERLYKILVPVEPSAAFVRRLGQELALAAGNTQLSLMERYRKVILVMAATLGSALSLLGLVLFYLFRQRQGARSTPAT
jgi:hypothetical protein